MFGGKCQYCKTKGKLKPNETTRMNINKEKILCSDCLTKIRRYDLSNHREKYCKIIEEAELLLEKVELTDIKSAEVFGNN